MRAALLNGVTFVLLLLLAGDASARTLRPKRIDIQYVAPKSEALNPVFELTKKARVLENVQQLLAPLRLPRRLLLKTEDCGGESNAWYDGEAVTVCYEFLDDIWKNVPEATTLAGLAPVDAFVGPVADVFLHEVGHAVFDLWKVPVLGREEDAADLFSIYIMLRFPKEQAHRLILGNAYQYKGDITAPTVTMSMRKFADEHGTPAQRFFNVLCMAYGADAKLFERIVVSGLLPKDRAEGCEDEYRAAAYAIETLMGRFIDRRLAKRLHQNWLPAVDRRPPRRPDSR
jgi:hypothetical protein